MTAGLVAVLTAACGGGGGDAADTAVEAGATSADEPSAAGAEVADDEEAGAIDRDAEAGERPEELPEDVPVPVGLRSVLFTGGDGTSIGFTGSLVSDDVAAVRDDFAEVLEAEGWEVTVRDPLDGVASLEATRGTQLYSVSMTALGEVISATFVLYDE